MMTNNFYQEAGLSDFVAATLFFETQDPDWIYHAGINLPKKIGFEECGFNRNQQCGFNRTVLTEKQTALSSAGAGLKLQANSNQPRSLNIPYSKNSNLEQVTRVKKTNNRKRPFNESHIEVDGVFFEVNASEKYAIYPEILTPMVRQLSIGCQVHGKVFSMRFELRLTKEHHYNGTESVFNDNGYMTAFIKRLMARLKHCYQMSRVGFQWVREMGREKDNGKVPHWHVALFLDGQKVNHSSTKKLLEHIKAAWSKNEFAGYASLSKDSCLMVEDESTFNNAVYQHSYLSKVRSKGYRPSQVKDFGTSRLKLKEFAA